jgi:hypothetical protein
MLDLGATSNFIQSADKLELTSPSFKTVSTANGHVMKATMTALLPCRQLKAGAREAIVIPEMSTKALISVKQYANQGYTTSSILTYKESPSMTMTASNLSQASRHCSKGGETLEDCGLYLSRRRQP